MLLSKPPLQSMCTLSGFCFLVILSLLSGTDASIRSKCDTCKGIGTKFYEGIKKTAKSNFGGGNTHWEEKSLGTFASSETRLIEIMEDICDSKEWNDRVTAITELQLANVDELLNPILNFQYIEYSLLMCAFDQCHSFVEENEELIEQWWFKVFGKGMETNLTVWLCERRLKVCCPDGTYGEECQECPGGASQPCSGLGKCSGDGYREGTGACSCNSGYTGDTCAQCKEGYYESDKNDTHTTCSACHRACKTGCHGDKETDCIDCKDCWTFTEGVGCADVDECAAEDSPCDASKYCFNNIGSYSCLLCSTACSGCHGAGSDQCKECAARHFKDGNTCKACHAACANSCSDDKAVSCDSCGDGWTEDSDSGCKDVDECADSPCVDGEVCQNNEGSYYCQPCHPACATCSGVNDDECSTCSSGYTMSEGEGKCVDIDECGGEKTCTQENELCVNTIGSYNCQCKDGYKRAKNKCVKASKKTPSKKSKSSIGSCSTCKTIAENFDKGLKKTENLNFGGGNTKWEEKKLGSYATSETRMVEIIEGLCTSDEKECHSMVESYEEPIERWWSENIKLKTQDVPILDYLCVQQAKICCGSGTFGPKCSDCVGGSKTPCSGNGKCDGDGTRKGTGKCTCDTGYRGDSCNECADGYFEESLLDKHVKCTACHESCKSTCWEAGPRGCDECRDGWSHSDDVGCTDINECLNEDKPCATNEFCVNSEGSYRCESCHGGCLSCTGPGLDGCVECSEGYEKVNEKCADINECERKEVCLGENEKCLNTLGSYECYCAEGSQRDEHNNCNKIPPAPTEDITEEPTHPPADDQSEGSRDEL